MDKLTKEGLGVQAVFFGQVAGKFIGFADGLVAYSVALAGYA